MGKGRFKRAYSAAGWTSVEVKNCFEALKNQQLASRNSDPQVVDDSSQVVENIGDHLPTPCIPQPQPEVAQAPGRQRSAHLYAPQDKNQQVRVPKSEPQVVAVEIKLHAKQRAGQMLVEGKKAGDLAKAGDNQRGSAKACTTSIGITRHESSDWQKLAAVPEPVLVKAIAVVKERDGVLTEGKKAGDVKPQGGKQSTKASTLPQVGITRNESSRRTRPSTSEIGITRNKSSKPDRPIMFEIGITHHESSDWQKLAAVPEKVLVEGKKAGDLKTQGQPKKGSSPPTLKQVGISKDESSDWQKLASVPEKVLVEGKRAGDLRKNAEGQKPTKAVRLQDVGITHNESSDWQKLAKVPEKVLVKAIAVVKEREL